MPSELTFHPLTPERWPDLERLFGPRGACAGCWCMWWRIPRAEWRAGKGEGNRAALERYVAGGTVAGLLAYDGAEPVGWVAVEPRAAYPGLARSRNLAAVDGAPVWSITCFFVSRAWRGRGLVARLVEAAANYARAAGAPALEAYPVDPKGETADAWLYTGVASTFRKLGFREVARRAPTRPVMRLELPPSPRPSPPRAAGERGRGSSAAQGATRPARRSSRARTTAKRGSRRR